MATNVMMKSKFIHCGHCDKEVSRTKYYAHKRLYYYRRRKKWSQFSQTKRPLHLTDEGNKSVLSSLKDILNVFCIISR